MTIIVTSALPYVNNEPHLGNIIGSVLSADIYSRYLKSYNENVYFISGSDEHGTTTEVESIKKGVSCEELCNLNLEKHKNIYKWFNIDFDVFGRTSDEDHKATVQEIFEILYDKEFIYPQKVKEFICDRCNKSVADRHIIGICYVCKRQTKGDQCDDCGEIIDLNRIIDPKCNACKTDLKYIETEHLFLALTKLKKELEEFNYSSSDYVKSISRSFLKNLTDRCITRSINFGIDVPIDGFKNKKIYVWFEAPIAYITFMRRCIKSDYKSVTLEQFMGKDNIPFHTVLFPATVMAYNSSVDETKRIPLVNKINSTHYLMWGNNKFSKSKNIGLFGSDIIELSSKLNIDSDYIRFYLTKIRPENTDSHLFLEKFYESVNSDLVNNFGNLINRIVTLSIKQFGEKTFNIDKYAVFKTFSEDYNEFRELYMRWDLVMSHGDIREGLDICLKTSDMLNRFLQKHTPWKEPDQETKSQCLQFSVYGMNKLTEMIKPFIPIATRKIRESLDYTSKGDSCIDRAIIRSMKPLFNKIKK